MAVDVHPAEALRPGRMPAGARLGTAGVLLALGAVLLLAAGWHLTQGTSGVGPGDLARLAVGERSAVSEATRNVLTGSRIPRVAAAIAVGFALGVAGALFQSLARNALASPDTLAVTAGAYLAVTVVAAFGLAVPLWASGAVAFAGGIAAAAVVLGVAGGAGTSTTRVVLAGSALALALHAATAALLILFQEETTGLYAWGSGSLSQLGLTAFWRAAPLVLGATALAMVLARRLDLLGLGDDAASSLGVPVRSTRIGGIVLAVLLTAAAVTLAGPIGFVGLCAPVITRLVGTVVPALNRHLVLLPAVGLVGALVVVLSDAVVRAVLGADEGVTIPTGVSTTLLGAVVLVLLARRGRDAGPARRPTGAGVPVRSDLRFRLVLATGVLVVGGAVLLGLLAGHTWLLTGDLALWAAGDAPPLVSFALDERAPRVAAALAAGAALALSGALVQATCRNPLAEPGLLGITGGAGVGAVLVVTGGTSVFAEAGTAPGTGQVVAAGTLGALLAFALVYGLSWRGGLDADRLVLIGIGTWAASTAISTFLLVRASPWDTPRIYTWLAGTTYGRGWEDVLPVGLGLALALPIALAARRELDLLAVDDDTPRLAGVGLERTRLLLLGTAALLAAMSVAAVGVVAFVGLVAPHAARALVGGRATRYLPVAVLLGAGLLVVADTLGRTVIAPAQFPAGLAVALIGAPYFVHLLARSRA